LDEGWTVWFVQVVWSKGILCESGLERILAEGDHTGDHDENNPAEEEKLTRVN
jgi:hypothetical protein